MTDIINAAIEGASADELSALPMPESYRAAYVQREDASMFEGMASEDKDPRQSLKVGEVDLPELAPDEAYVLIMASSINFNTVWTSIFEPLSTFGFLDRLGKESVWGARHALDKHVVGSDGSGIVLKTGSAVRSWGPGDKVTLHCNYVDDQDPTAHDDSMMAVNQRIWGFETNFGGLAEIAVVKANQLMPKPTHLTWEEAAINALCNSTSYRMVVSPNGANMTQGDKAVIEQSRFSFFTRGYCILTDRSFIRFSLEWLADLFLEVLLSLETCLSSSHSTFHTMGKEGWRSPETSMTVLRLEASSGANCSMVTLLLGGWCALTWFEFEWIRELF